MYKSVNGFFKGGILDKTKQNMKKQMKSQHIMKSKKDIKDQLVQSSLDSLNQYRNM